MTYVLHYAPDNASLIVRLALDHAGAAFRTALVDRGAQAQRSAAYLAINPNGLIPALETPDGVMFETTAILLWLAERHPGLLPAAGADRAMALKWLVWLGNTVHPNLRMVFYPDQYTDGDPQPVRASARARVIRSLAILDTAPDAAWLDDETGAAPAFYLAALLRWCQLYGGAPWFDPAPYPRLFACAARLEPTPAVARACTAEGLGPTPFTAPRAPCPPEGSAT